MKHFERFIEGLDKAMADYICRTRGYRFSLEERIEIDKVVNNFVEHIHIQTDRDATQVLWEHKNRQEKRNKSLSLTQHYKLLKLQREIKEIAGPFYMHTSFAGVIYDIDAIFNDQGDGFITNPDHLIYMAEVLLTAFHQRREAMAGK